MANKSWWARYWGLFLGIPFTLFVVGLIVYGNFFASSSHETQFAWEYRPVLYVCDSAPKWTHPEQPQFVKATEWWEDLGWAFSNIEVGPCPTTCKVKDKKTGETMNVVCNPGKVTLDLMDQWFEPEHAGVCRYPEKLQVSGVARDIDWVTILVPNVILGSDDLGEFGSDTPMLPVDAEAMVLAHEIGHCLAGLGHNEGPPVGCARLNPKTGSMMNPNVYKGGWLNEAIPEPPWEW